LLSEAKSYFANIVKSEQSLLAMPFEQLIQKSSLRLFSRMGKLNDLLDWENADSHFFNGTNFTIVPVQQDIKPLKNKKVEVLRSIVFYKEGADKMQMRIIEILSSQNSSLGKDTKTTVRTAFENMHFGKTQEIGNIDAFIFFYDRYYYQQNSFQVFHGKWSGSKIRMKYQAEPSLNNTVKNAASGQPAKKINLYMDPTQNCIHMYLVGFSYSLATGEIYTTEILDEWDECNGDRHIVPLGGPPGGGVLRTPDPEDLPELTSRLTNPCLVAAYNKILGNLMSVTNEFQTSMSSHLVPAPYSFDFKEDPNLLDKDGNIADGGTDISTTDPLNIIIRLNPSTLPNTSLEYTAMIMLHETIHALLIQYGAPATDQLYQHSEIANQYRNYVVDALRASFPNLSAAQADALSCASLGDSKGMFGWDSLSTSEQLGIIAVVNSFHQRNGSGTNC
jgi:hypothetical protein